MVRKAPTKSIVSPFPLGKGSFTPHVLSGDGFLPKSIHPVSRYDFLSISWRLGPHACGGLRLRGEIFNLCSAAKSFKMRSNTFTGPNRYKSHLQFCVIPVCGNVSLRAKRGNPPPAGARIPELTHAHCGWVLSTPNLWVLSILYIHQSFNSRLSLS